MDVLRTLEKSANSTAAIARGVQPEQFDSPTPSAEWNVEKLMKFWTCIGTPLFSVLGLPASCHV